LDEYIRNLLKDVDWERITLKLIEYATYKAGRLYWQSGNYQNLSQGKAPEDIAQEAIAKTLGGERTWDPNKQIDIFIHLKTVVDSLISHLVESDNHKRRQPLLHSPRKEGIDINKIPDPGPTQDEELTQEESYFRTLGKFRAAVKGDKELEAFLEAMIDGEIKIDIDIKRRYQLKRKIKRRLRELNKDD